MPRRLLSVFGVGRVPLAPGTAGSAVALAMYLGASSVLGGWVLSAACAAAAAVFGAMTVALAPRVVREEGEPDPQLIVTDEMSGMFVALIWTPLSAAPAGLASDGGSAGVAGVTLAVALFACFRLLDVLKPLGIRRLERLGGGWGVLADDLAAGAAANLLVALGSRVVAGFAG